MPEKTTPTPTSIEVKPFEKITIKGVELTVTSFGNNSITLATPEGVNIKEGK